MNVAFEGPRIMKWQVPLRTPGLQLDAYVGTAGRHHLSEDALLVTESAGRMTLAVADGVTPTPATPAVRRMNGARYAACTVLDEVRRTDPQLGLSHAFLAANARLMREFGPDVRPDLEQRDRPQAAAVGVELLLDAVGRPRGATALRAADCDVWVRRDGRWSLATPASMLRDETRDQIDDWTSRHPRASLAQRLEMERDVITGRQCWNLTALGRFAIPKVRQRAIDASFDDLVLVTDGPNVRRAVAADISEPHQWLATLRSWEAVHRPGYKQHDDVAMLHLRVARL